jgi:hypothetical protein
VTIGVIVGVAANASPLDIVARYQFDASVDVVGRRATVELRVRDEGRAPVADLPVLIEFTPVENGSTGPLNRVLMTDRDGVISSVTPLSDGQWAWQIDALPDRFIQTEPAIGTMLVAPAVVSIDLPLESIRLPGVPVDLSAVLAVGASRAGGIEARARLQCPGSEAQTLSIRCAWARFVSVRRASAGTGVVQRAHRCGRCRGRPLR